MNQYYATGSPIFEGPPRKNRKPSYGSSGHLTNHLHKFQIKIKYNTNPENRSSIDMLLTAPNGKELFINASKHNQMREEVYKWVEENGIKRDEDEYWDHEN